MDYLNGVYVDGINLTYNLGGYFSITKKDDWSLGKHVFNQCKFYYVTEGECIVNFGDKDCKVSAGEWLFIPANVEHSYYYLKTGNFKKYWVHFDIYPDSNSLAYLNLPFKINVGVKGEVYRLFRKLTKCANSERLTDKLMVKSCLFSLLSEFIKGAGVSDLDGCVQGGNRLREVVKYINENLSGDLSVNVLAEKYFAHPNHFIRAFKKETGLTPAKFVKQRRLEVAKTLLEKTELNVYEVADKVGITDVAHFSRDFKSYYNVPPKKYKKYYAK